MAEKVQSLTHLVQVQPQAGIEGVTVYNLYLLHTGAYVVELEGMFLL